MTRIIFVSLSKLHRRREFGPAMQLKFSYETELVKARHHKIARPEQSTENIEIFLNSNTVDKNVWITYLLNAFHARGGMRLNEEKGVHESLGMRWNFISAVRVTRMLLHSAPFELHPQGYDYSKGNETVTGDRCGFHRFDGEDEFCRSDLPAETCDL